MLPDGVLSTQVISGSILPPRDKPKELLIDYDMGPVNISDPTQGMKVKVWTGYVNGGWVTYKADGVTPYPVYETGSITELSITFDQNGRPCFGFSNDSGANLYWYDTLTNAYEVLNVGRLAYNPRVFLDDKREFNIAQNDILFFYILNGYLCVRYQRERFLTEHQLTTVNASTIIDNVGMNNKLRVQLNLKVASA